MSDEEQTHPNENDAIPENIVELAEEYLDLIVGEETDTESDERDLEELKEEVEQWNTELESLDEDDELYAIGVEERDNLKRRIEERNQTEKRREQIRQELVERTASEFVARDQWLDTSVIKAITYELLGEAREEILVDEYRLPDAELDNKSLFAVSRNVRAVASHTNSSDERISNLWDSIDGTRQYPIVKVLFDSAELLGPSGIADEIQDEDRDRRHIADALGKMRDRQYHPYFRGDDGYALSLVGEYVWKEFGPDVKEDSEESSTEGGEDNGEDESPDSELTNFQDD
ncbi:hypothetical protein DU504_17045 [Haloplanus salinus]|uniref:Uncharacterized protein n=1 Tax=Haloplanus salinus TaxID=1126245 RepID=A0A368N5C8_9EURY|nr:hypothetical protein [Haloplanus salinus]RCU44449.1 hypothetical protein DU504_17045 [Haloplanus salinus]